MIAGALVLLAIFIFVLRRLLDVTKPVDEGQRPSISTALNSRWAVFGAVAIFLYVGAEVSIGSAMTNFLHEPDMLACSLEQAGKLVSFYWGGAMVGRLIGSGLLFLVKQRAPWLLAGFCARRRRPVPRRDAAAWRNRGLSRVVDRAVQLDHVPGDLHAHAGALDRGAGGDFRIAVPGHRRRRNPALHLWHDRRRRRVCIRLISCLRWPTPSS